MTRIPLYDKNGDYKSDLQCPFGERDLRTDECYSGMGKNRCPYFVKYEHLFSDETPDGRCQSYIVCTNKHKDTQLTLF